VRRTVHVARVGQALHELKLQLERRRSGAVAPRARVVSAGRRGWRRRRTTPVVHLARDEDGQRPRGRLVSARPLHLLHATGDSGFATGSCRLALLTSARSLAPRPQIYLSDRFSLLAVRLGRLSRNLVQCGCSLLTWAGLVDVQKQQSNLDAEVQSMRRAALLLVLMAAWAIAGVRCEGTLRLRLHKVVTARTHAHSSGSVQSAQAPVAPPGDEQLLNFRDRCAYTPAQTGSEGSPSTRDNSRGPAKGGCSR